MIELQDQRGRSLGRLIAGCVAATLWAGSAFGATLPTANLLVQLEGDQLTGLDSGTFTWQDQASNGGYTPAITSVAGLQPTVVANGSPNGAHDVVHFDGSDALNIGASASFDTNQLTWVVVFRPSSVTTTQYVMGASYTSLDGGSTNPDNFGTNHAWGTFIENSLIRNFARSSTGSTKSPFPSGHTATTDWWISVGDWNGDLIHNYIFDDTASEDAAAVLSGATGSPSGSKIIRLGADPQSSSNAPLTGDIAAVLIYSAPLGTENREAAVNYLYEKYFIPEPASSGLLGAGCAVMGLRRRRNG